MALEIEYADVDDNTNLVETDIGAADLVNGDGTGPSLKPKYLAVLPEHEATAKRLIDDHFDQETEVGSVNQGECSPTLVESVSAAVPANDSCVVTNCEGMHDATIKIGTSTDIFGVNLPGPRRPSIPPWMLDDPAQATEFTTLCDAAEATHLHNISEAKEGYSSLALRRSELESELKDLKADEKAALRGLSNLIARGPNYPQPKSKIDEAVAAAGERSAIVVDDPNEDKTWMLIETASILDGIKGMGGKKAEAIISLAPTLGDLEELRAKAGLAHKPYSSVLPKGIGENLADEIQERVYLAMKRHKEELAKAKEKQE